MLAPKVRAVPVRVAGWAVAGAVLAAVCIDGGSVVLSQVQVADASAGAARAAVQAVSGQPVNQETALAAYAAASEALANERDRVVLQAAGDDADFRVLADRSVTLTVRRVAPTLLLQHLPGLGEYAEVTVTTHQAALQ